MRPFAALGLLVMLTAVMAGCVDGNERDDDDGAPPLPVVPETWALDALPSGEGHDHLDFAQHQNLSTPNFEVLGWDPLVTDYHDRSSGSYMCGDVSETGDRRIGVVHSHITDVAFVVVDVTDAAAPVMVGEMVMPNTFIYDVAITPDARFVVLATSDPSAQASEETPAKAAKPGPFGDQPYFRDCTGAVKRVQGPLDQAPYAAGVVLVDLADPSAPMVMDYTPMPILGAHSIFATQVDGTYFVLGAATNLEHHGSYFQVITIDTILGRPKLVVQSTIRPAPPTEGEQPRINGHVDGWIQKHPVTGTLVASLVDWDGGLVLYDLSDPRRPVETGRWSNYAGHSPTSLYGDDSGSIHSAVPLSVTWDDRHYTIIGQEILGRPTDTPTGMIWIMDTTDIEDPHPVAGWTLPVDPIWGDTLMFSTHYPTVDETNRMLYVTMYHGGVWAVDLANVTSPETVGVFLPTNESPKPPGELFFDYNWTPVVLEAEVIGPNTLLVWEGGSGVYTVRFLPEVPMPDIEEWPVTIA